MPLSADLLKAAAVWCLVVILISAIAASFATTWLQVDFADLRTVINQEHAEVQRQLGTKVDQETRRAMLADLEHRLERIERHLQLLDTRVNVILEDRREGMSRGQRGDAGRYSPSVYEGMDGTNLSGNGSASAIAYSRKIRDRLRPLEPC